MPIGFVTFCQLVQHFNDNENKKKKVLYTTSKNIASAQCPHTQCLALCSLCLCAQKTCAQSADGRTTFSLQAFLHIDLAKNQTEMVANKP